MQSAIIILYAKINFIPSEARVSGLLIGLILLINVNYIGLELNWILVELWLTQAL